MPAYLNILAIHILRAHAELSVHLSHFFHQSQWLWLFCVIWNPHSECPFLWKGNPNNFIAALAATSFPRMPIWSDFLHRIVVLFCFLVRFRYVSCMEFRRSQPCSSCSAEIQSKKMVNLPFSNSNTLSRASCSTSLQQWIHHKFSNSRSWSWCELQSQLSQSIS